jgi:hypothetical protein
LFALRILDFLFLCLLHLVYICTHRASITLVYHTFTTAYCLIEHSTSPDNMAPVVWGLDLAEIKWSKFKSSYMWNNEYHLRRTKFIVYQCALIFCVISESLGTDVLSGKHYCVPFNYHHQLSRPKQTTPPANATWSTSAITAKQSLTTITLVPPRTTSSLASLLPSSSARHSSSTSSGPNAKSQEE